MSTDRERYFSKDHSEVVSFPILPDSAHVAADTPAVIFDETVWTYGELARRTAAIAARLVGAGVGPDTLVGLNVGRSPHMVAGLLAIHAAGGAYVPLDPGYPRERLDHLAADAGLRYVLHDGRPTLGRGIAHAVDVTMVPSASTDRAPTAGAPGDLAYVMYTSGSTGRPKGVRVHRGAVRNFLQSMRRKPGLEPHDVLLAVTTPAFDISVLELLLPLAVGATIVLAARPDVTDGRALARLIERHGVTVMQATPSTWRMMLASGWVGDGRLKALCGGEPLDRALAGDLLAATGELWNMYGPTETTVWSTCGRIDGPDAPITVGHAIDDTTIHVLDPERRPVPAGAEGEVHIGGAGVAAGYTDPTLTAERFLPDPFATVAGTRLYRTGDVGRLLPDGRLVVLGRSDDQVKVRGHRIELDEVRGALLEQREVDDAAVLVARDEAGETVLKAFVVAGTGRRVDAAALRRDLAQRLPDYMIPSRIVEIPAMPLMPNGKIDRARLSGIDGTDRPAGTPAPKDGGDAVLDAIVELASGLTGGLAVGADDSLFDLGLTSLQLNHLAARFSDRTGVRASVAEIFAHPTPRGLTAHLRRREAEPSGRETDATPSRGAAPTPLRGPRDDAVAVIGMSGRLPGARTLDAFWENLRAGRDTVTHFPPERDDPSVEEHVVADPRYVRARGIIEDPDLFDAALFGFLPHEAAVMDPQQRVFLEVAWEAFEHAGVDPDRFDGLVGVYAGMGNNFYYYYNVSSRPDVIRMVGEVQAEIGREKDHVATLVSHRLNLTGPSISVHTACSTGLVAIDSAFHSLLSGQCDMALAGAIELRTPGMSGQIHEPGGIFTADGRCRPFSDEATGTMFSDGAAAVVLRRLSDAIADGDTIHAVIRGSAVNHDGLHKKSYLAPSARAQSEVISLALRRAGVDAGSIGYVEAHGTATPVGDPIEFEALRTVFERTTDRRNYCALGSVKANVGHPTTAAGAVGVVKVAKMLGDGFIPPQIHVETVNRNIDLENSPFFISRAGQAWPSGPTPRRAGVSSFGFCGTNAHAILEEAPARSVRAPLPGRPWEVFALSAATPGALDRMAESLAARLDRADAPDRTDAAFTLATGRKRLTHRRFLVGRGRPETGGAPSFRMPGHPASAVAAGEAPPPVAFAFAGQGAQYLGMGRGLYQTEPVFRAHLDRCADLLGRRTGHDIRELLLAAETGSDEAKAKAAQLDDTARTQPAIFCLEYALAQLWLAWGVRPDVLIGHSIGEFVCGTLAGVFSLEAAIGLIAERGRLIAALEPGAMLSVRAPADTLGPRLNPRLSIAAVNGPTLCVVSGPEAEISALAATLATDDVRCQVLHTSHAFHSWMMDDAVAPFREAVEGVALSPPAVPVLSTVTGAPLTDDEATDPDYWAGHLRATVRFADAVSAFWARGPGVLLDIGPRGTTARLATALRRDPERQAAIATLADTSADDTESRTMAEAVGRLWQAGVEPDWNAYFLGRSTGRVPLPTYPFDRKRYWVEPGRRRRSDDAALPVADGTEDRGGPSAAADAPSAATEPADDRLMADLLAIFEEVSGRSLGGVDTGATFFDLGFDSLMLTPVAYMIKERFGADITFRQLVDDLASLDALAAHLRRDGDGPASGDDPPSVEVRPTALPLTGTQRYFLDLDRRTGSDAGSRDTARVRLRGDLDCRALSAAIAALVDRHPMLRARLASDGRTVEVAETSAAATVDPTAGRDDDGEPAGAPFDLTAEPGVRFVVRRGDDRAHEVRIVAHAALCDRWSLDVLIEELAALYSAETAGGSAPLAAAGRPETFVERQRQGDEAAAGLREDRLRTLGPLARLSDDRVPDPHRPGPVATVSCVLSTAETHALRSAAADWKVSLFVALMTAFAIALRRSCSPGAVVVTAPFAGQPTLNMPTLVGQFSALLPVALPGLVGGDPGSLLETVRAAILEAHESRGHPLAMPEREPGPSAADLTRFRLIHTKRLPEGACRFSGLEAEYDFCDPQAVAGDLVIDAVEHDDRLEIRAHFPAERVRESAVAAVLEDMRSSLIALAGPPAGADPGVGEDRRARETAP